MVPVRRLSKAEFLACFDAPMTDVTGSAEAAVDIWPYADRLSLDDPHLPALLDVSRVYRNASGCYDHVLVATAKPDTVLAVVVDVTRGAILGHHLLDLAAEYGVAGVQSGS